MIKLYFCSSETIISELLVSEPTVSQIKFNTT